MKLVDGKQMTDDEAHSLELNKKIAEAIRLLKEIRLDEMVVLTDAQSNQICNVQWMLKKLSE